MIRRVPMFVIKSETMSCVLELLRLFDGVGIVITENTLIKWVMQRQRISDTVRDCA